jgi:hypothetical protein
MLRSLMHLLLVRLSSPRGHRSRPAMTTGHLARGADLGDAIPEINQVVPLTITLKAVPASDRQ